MESEARSLYQSLGAVVAVFAGWVSLYLTLRHLWPSRSAEWHCREVTAIHALLVVCMSGWCGFLQGPWPFTDPGGPSTPLQHWTCTVCMAYFMFDLCWCLYFKTEGPVMLFHHCLSIAGTAIVVIRGDSGTEMIATIFGTELTNPLLQIRWFLRESGLHKTWYAEINNAAFILLFTFLRIGVASYLLYTHVQHPRPDWVAKGGGISIYIVGWLFWIAILKYAVKKYTKMYKLWQTSTNVTNGKVTNGKPHHNGTTTKNGSPGSDTKSESS